MKRSPAFFALVLTLALAPPAPAAANPETVPGAQTVDARQAKQLFDKGVTFVDLRRDRRWKAGRVPGAIHLEFRKKFNEATLGRHVGKDQAVAFYFDKCRRCAKAIEQAVAWGYTRVYFFRDGMAGWKKRGYPVEPSGQAGGTADARQQRKGARDQQPAKTPPPTAEPVPAQVAEAPAPKPAAVAEPAPSPSSSGASAAEQTEFAVILVSSGDMKIQVIKAVREITGLGLKEAKELVDNAPKPVKEGVSRDEALAMKDKLVAVGATVKFGDSVYKPVNKTVSSSPSGESAAIQTEFAVILVSVGDMKIQVIKAVREITGLGLKEAKELVDNAPKPVKEGVSKKEAFAMRDTLLAQGATVKLGGTVYKPENNTVSASPSATPAASPSASPAAEQSEFAVILVSVGDMKIQVIKAVREITGLGLKEAKELVDNAPKPVKEGVSRTEALAMKDKLLAVGATVELK